MTVMAVARLNVELSGAVSKVAELKSQVDVRLRKDRNIEELESQMKDEHERNEELAAQVDSIKLKQKSKDDHLCRLQVTTFLFCFFVSFPNSIYRNHALTFYIFSLSFRNCWQDKLIAS